MHVTIYTDGGSRNNPGPAALGYVIKGDDGAHIAAKGEYIGIKTNNYAEYSAVIASLAHAKELGATAVDLYSDSKLLVEQLNGNWKVKHPDMQKLFVQAYNIIQHFDQVSIHHVRREKNAEADALVNQALDAATEL